MQSSCVEYVISKSSIRVTNDQVFFLCGCSIILEPALILFAKSISLLKKDDVTDEDILFKLIFDSGVISTSVSVDGNSISS